MMYDPTLISYQELETHFDSIFERAVEGETFLIEDMGVVLCPVESTDFYD